MTDWIEHDGGPQPVADDVWVCASDPFEGNYSSESSDVDWPNAERYRVLNQHLIDAARLEGIRLGLEAAAEVSIKCWRSERSHYAHLDIRNLDPETIAKEAAPPARKDHRADAAADAFYVEEADQ